MALKTPSKTTGELKWGAAKSWTPEGEPGSGDDVEFPAGSKVTMVAAGAVTCRSCVEAVGFEGKLIGKVKGELIIGNSEAAGSGYAWRMQPGAFTAEAGSTVRFHSTNLVTKQKILTGGNAFKEVQSGGAGVTEGLYTLEDDFKALESGTQSILWDGGTWDWNGHNVEAWGFETGASKQKPRTGTLKLTGAGGTAPILKIEAATEWLGSECTIEFTDTSATEKKVTSEGSSRVLAAVLILTNGVYLSASKGEVKVGKLRVNTAPGAIGIRLDPEYVLRVTGALEANGTEEAHRVLMKLVSESVSEAACWKLVNETGKAISVDFVELQGSKAEGEPCYAGTHSKEDSNVHNWKFEAAPSGGALKGAISASSTVAGAAQAPGRAKGAITTASSIVGAAQGVGRLVGATQTVASLSGRANAPGSPVGHVSATATIAPHAQAPGALRGDVTGAGAFVARLQASGVLRGVVAASAALSGRLNAGGVLKGAVQSAASLVAQAQSGGLLQGLIAAAGALRGKLSGAPQVSERGIAVMAIRQIGSTRLGVGTVNSGSLSVTQVNDAKLGIS